MNLTLVLVVTLPGAEVAHPPPPPGSKNLAKVESCFSMYDSISVPYKWFGLAHVSQCNKELQRAGPTTCWCLPLFFWGGLFPNATPLLGEQPNRVGFCIVTPVGLPYFEPFGTEPPWQVLAGLEAEQRELEARYEEIVVWFHMEDGAWGGVGWGAGLSRQSNPPPPVARKLNTSTVVHTGLAFFRVPPQRWCSCWFSFTNPLTHPPNKNTSAFRDFM